ncbi:hypothetical protein [Dinoroseobacter sp. S124A]|uniref:hypothetical protein n=1 Tax=Dinoroseobacter sp. S124A TaxID=3415128 RepID=UPI003C7D7B7C
MSLRFGLAVAVLSCACSAQAATFYDTRTDFDQDVASQSDPTGMSGATTQAEADALTKAGRAIETAPQGSGRSADDIEFDALTIVDPFAFPRGSTLSSSHGFRIYSFANTAGIDGAAYRIGNVDNENHSYLFSTGVEAFAFDFYDPKSASQCGGVPCAPSFFDVIVYDTLGDEIAKVRTGTNYGGTTFFGVSSAELIGRIDVVEASTGAGVFTGDPPFDNEYFGNYTTGRLATTVPPVPLPASLPLLGLGLAAAATLRVRRKRG